MTHSAYHCALLCSGWVGEQRAKARYELKRMTNSVDITHGKERNFSIKNSSTINLNLNYLYLSYNQVKVLKLSTANLLDNLLISWHYPSFLTALYNPFARQ